MSPDDNGDLCGVLLMQLPIFHIDAFTDRLFSGNPAAVVILDEWLDDATLQTIAAENNLSETAFVIPQGASLPLRWFTPVQEVDLCGHATLAAAAVLFRQRFPEQTQLSFMTRSGVMTVARDDGQGGRLWLDFPARPGAPVPVPSALAEALGAVPLAAFQARDLMCVFDGAAAVAALRPDFKRLAELDVFAVIATAPGEDVDFVSRFFAPRAGIDEDPVTGSAHCTLIPYWAEQFGRDSLTARQISTRGGMLWCEARGERVGIGGQVVEFSRGEITLPG